MGARGKRTMIWLGDPNHGRMIANLAGVDFDHDRNPVISIARQGYFVGGVIFTNYSKRAIWVHTAAVERQWLTRDFLWMVFDYPFYQLNVEQLMTSVRSNNERILKSVHKLGFHEIGRIPGIVVGGDLVLLSMSRNECKWLNLRPHSAARERLECGTMAPSSLVH